MTKLYLIEHDLVLLVIGAGSWLTVGACIGAVHFFTLRWNVRMLANGQSIPVGLATQLVRFALIAGALAAIAVHFGAWPLLVATAGILAARTMVLRLG